MKEFVARSEGIVVLKGRKHLLSVRLVQHYALWDTCAALSNCQRVSFGLVRNSHRCIDGIKRGI